MKKISSRHSKGQISERVLPFFIALLVFVPAFASASVQITEVMYDTPGGDSGREWIEVTNNGSQSVDIAKYKLAEGGTNHGLKIAAGNTFLSPGASAVIVEDPAAFKADWPSFMGTIFDSTFSLSNTGETLSIKNASSSVEDTVTYSASVGANGDGGSLHRSGDSPAGEFIAALPNPGEFPGTIKPVPVVEKPVLAPITKTTKTKSTSSTFSKKQSSSQTAAVAAVPQNTFDPANQQTSSTTPVVYWVLGLFALCAVGVAGVVFVSRGQPTSDLVAETIAREEEFEIIET
jgi:hypothetical protein